MSRPQPATLPQHEDPQPSRVIQPKTCAPDTSLDECCKTANGEHEAGSRAAPRGLTRVFPGAAGIRMQSALPRAIDSGGLPPEAITSCRMAPRLRYDVEVRA